MADLLEVRSGYTVCSSVELRNYELARSNSSEVSETVVGGGRQSPSFLSIVLWPSAVYIAVQLLEGWLLTPWIQSGQTNLSAATIIIVVFIGAGLAGILGMLLAIPVGACSKILLDETVLPRIRRWASEH